METTEKLTNVTCIAHSAAEVGPGSLVDSGDARQDK